jgi:Tfp pilus assembly protein FimV
MVAIYAPRDHEQASGPRPADDHDLAPDDASTPYSRWNAPEPGPGARSPVGGQGGRPRGAVHLAVVAPARSTAAGGAAIVAVPARSWPADETAPPYDGAVAPATRRARPARPLPSRATRVRRRRLVVLVALIAAVVGVMAGARGLASLSDVPASPHPAPLGGQPAGSAPVAGHTYVVQPGDTLWSIARTIAPDRDPRPVVDALRKANGGPNLEVGDRLTLEAG